jgi:hypothetical protein
MRRNNTDVVVAWVIAATGLAALAVRMPVPVTVLTGTAMFAAAGYVWSEMLLGPRAAALHRAVTSACLALMIPIFAGLILDAAGIPLRTSTWPIALAVAIVIGVVVLPVQRRAAAPPVITPPIQDARPAAQKCQVARHAVALGAAAVIAAVAVALSIYGASAQKVPDYTQLWMSPIASDPAAAADIGVTNHGGAPARYRLVLTRRGRVSSSWNISLADGQTWERVIPFSQAYRIAAKLYRRPDLRHVYRTVDNGG